MRRKYMKRLSKERKVNLYTAKISIVDKFDKEEVEDIHSIRDVVLKSHKTFDYILKIKCDKILVKHYEGERDSCFLKLGEVHIDYDKGREYIDITVYLKYIIDQLKLGENKDSKQLYQEAEEHTKSLHEAVNKMCGNG